MKPEVDPQSMKSMMASVPSPGISPLRQALQIGRHQLEFLRQNRATHGDVFSLEIPNEPPRVVLGHPLDIKEIFALRPERYYSADQSTHANIGERCVLFADDERHRSDRSLLSPPLHGQFLEGYGPHMLECTESAIDRWLPGTQLLLQEELGHITLRVITRCVLGADEEPHQERLHALITEWAEHIYSQSLFTVASLVGLNRMRRFLERKTNERREERHGLCPYPGRKSTGLKAEFMTILEEDVEQCRKERAEGRDDVLARIAVATYEDGELMDMHTVLDQLTLLFSAGHETTAKSLGWAVRDILERPTLLSRLREEIADHFGDGPMDPSACRRLPLLNSVIKESMRLHPVTALVQRELTEPLELRELTLVTGTVAVPSNYLAHRHPDYWERPDDFVPERFIDLKPPPHVYFPFGGGRRKCLGATFAEFEMPIVLAAILRRVDLAFVPGVAIEPVYGGVTIGPSNGLPLKVEAVRAAYRFLRQGRGH
jgi:cytochrome P450